MNEQKMIGIRSGGECIRLAAEGILRLNATLESRGLALTPDEARELAETRQKSLTANSRVELGLGAVEKLILKFSASGYAARESWTELLNLALELFYFVKTETRDGVSDVSLIDFMSDSFEKNGGSPELLAESCERLITRLNCGGIIGDRIAGQAASDDDNFDGEDNDNDR